MRAFTFAALSRDTTVPTAAIASSTGRPPTSVTRAHSSASSPGRTATMKSPSGYDSICSGTIRSPGPMRQVGMSCVWPSP